jgi:hypothetical protein
MNKFVNKSKTFDKIMEHLQTQKNIVMIFQTWNIPSYKNTSIVDVQSQNVSLG